MIFVGCASRSPAAYERGINYPASVWSLLRSLFASLPFHLTSFPLCPSRRPTISFRLLRQSLPVVVRSSLSVSLASTGVSIMTPRGGTIPEVKSERRNHDVHSMESLSSNGAGCSKVSTHATRSLSRARQGKSASFDRRGSCSAFARTRVTREQLPRKSRVDISG